MTRLQIITRLERQYAHNRRSHGPTAVVWRKLNAAVTRQLMAERKARKRLLHKSKDTGQMELILHVHP